MEPLWLILRLERGLSRTVVALGGLKVLDLPSGWIAESLSACPDRVVHGGWTALEECMSGFEQIQRHIKGKIQCIHYTR